MISHSPARVCCLMLIRHSAFRDCHAIDADALPGAERAMHAMSDASASFLRYSASCRAASALDDCFRPSRFHISFISITSSFSFMIGMYLMQRYH